MSYAFPKALRLLKKEEYERVFKQTAKKINTGLFLVLVVPNDKEVPRLGFALSKKVLPKAFMRNRAKRLFREEFRLRCSALKPVDLVVLARPALKDSSNLEIRSSFSILWRKIGQL